MNILMPTDLNELCTASKNALKLAETIEEPVALHLIHIIDPALYTLGDMNGNIVMHSETLNLEMDRAKDALKHAETDILREFKFDSVHSELLIGSVEHQIIEYAQNHELDLIISTTEGTHSFFRYIQGSLTGNLTRKINIPILAVPKSTPLTLPLEHLLVAHEFSQKNFRIESLNEHRFFKALTAITQKTVLVEVVKDAEQSSKALEAMYEFSANTNFPNLTFHTPVDVELENGLSTCLEDYPNALLCIGNHQNKGFEYFLEGCTATELINKYDRPLLSFPLKEDE
jgi:nucleotide-binding universal stress UspA family protein